MENLKMHFEAQMENLNRELLATRSQAPARPPSWRVGAPWDQDPWSHRSVGSRCPPPPPPTVAPTRRPTVQRRVVDFQIRTAAPAAKAALAASARAPWPLRHGAL